MKTITFALLLTALGLGSGSWAAGLPDIPGLPHPTCHPVGSRPWLHANQTPECRALEALAVLTPPERVYFDGGGFGALGATPTGAGAASAPVDPAVVAARQAAAGAAAKLGLPPIGGASDGPNGIADLSSLFGQPTGERSRHVTAFPNVIALGASWDRELARRFGAALGEEFRGKGLTADLGPTLNLIRTWHGGRSAETYGEDPYLIGELAVPEIAAIQSRGVIVTMKHFAANNQEFARVGTFPDNAGVDEHISDKALEEVFLPHFKAAVQRAHVGSVMCAYNQVNAMFSCDNAALLAHLRSWGFDGVIVPDASFAQRDAVAAARAGMDAAAPAAAVEAAITRSEVDPHFFDYKVYRTLVTRFRLGLYERGAVGRAAAVVSTPEHQALAREIAASGAVLLKNTGVLPFGKLRSLAVIGADAGPEAVVMESGSPNVHIDQLDVPLDAIRTRAGAAVQVGYERGSVGVRALGAVPAAVLQPPSHQGQGLEGTYFGTPFYWSKVATRVDATIQVGADPGVPEPAAGTLGKREFPRGRGPWSVSWQGWLLPPATGRYAFSLSGAGSAQLFIDDKLVTAIRRADFPMTTVGVMDLKTGRPHSILIRYDTASAVLGAGMRLGWQPPDSRLERAVELAQHSDAAVVFVGEQLGEGGDKQELGLPGDQDALIEAVAAANPRTVVVLHTSTAVAMPWATQVAGIVEAWYPGQAAGASIAAVLFGDVNPSGHLPVTFPRDATQGPATHWWEYPGDGRDVDYSEGVLVGYRWYDAHAQEPLFAFGHGLSYTTFSFSDLKITGTGAGRQVTVRLQNTGPRAGAEVLQLYVGMPEAAGEPPRLLKGFQKVMLKPGESRVVSMDLPDASLEVFDADRAQWALLEGSYRVMVGASSRDIRQEGAFNIEHLAAGH
ncbi:MAG TPA: glycoside hydrolase family 3 C-terminal domain-containing protein [Steroidobacteraceae bacterium]|nr:glycoside hydrolase family 3 C-terminal domain-containing protein [Steroidobacteraceae bacterium]